MKGLFGAKGEYQRVRAVLVYVDDDNMTGTWEVFEYGGTGCWP